MLRMIIHQIILLHRYKGNSNYTRSCHLRRGILDRHRGAVGRIPPPARRSSAAGVSKPAVDEARSPITA